MYIIELFVKIIRDIKDRKFSRKDIKQKEKEHCDHLFVPIDSTKKILACAKCGEIYKIKDGEINPFEK